MSALKEFKAFILRGNVLDMAVGVIVGGAFGKIVSSLVNDVIMPPIGRVLGGVDFKDLFVSLDGRSYATLADAAAAGAPVMKLGLFFNTVLDFLIVAAVIFFVVNRLGSLFKPKPVEAAPAEPTVKECPDCCEEVKIKARKCRHCGHAF